MRNVFSGIQIWYRADKVSDRNFTPEGGKYTTALPR